MFLNVRCPSILRPKGSGIGEAEQATRSAHIVATLQELIEAIDSRVPQVDRIGETQIATDAAALRQEAVKRIEELTRT